jgi:serine/threonine protein kinase
VETVGRYRIARVLRSDENTEILEAYAGGEGGFERRVAIKRPKAEALDQSLIEAYVDEARILSRLHHANIVGVLDFAFADEVPFQVLEYVDGLDLEAIARRAKEKRSSIGESLALWICLEVAHALGHAHEATDDDGSPLRIVHRDVSPSNVLVSWSGDVKLADFGIAVAAGRKARTQVGYAKGKPAFMAPEQWLGSDVDARTDIFALGCVLHWMIAGASPIEDDRARKEIIRGAQAALSPSLPDDVRVIVARALRSNKGERHPSAAAFAAECAAALTKRALADGRSKLRDLMSSLGSKVEPRARNAASLLMNVELILDPTVVKERRFTTLTKPERRTDVIPAEQMDATPILPPSTGTDPAIGMVLHGYRIEEMIGRGAIASVYRAAHTRLRKECAIKVLSVVAASRKTCVERLLREAEMLSSLDHPNLVRVLDCGTTPSGAPFLSMELLRGLTLSQVLSRGPLSAPRAANIARQIALGLAEAHGRAFVHRDLKPSNVMLVTDGDVERVKLLDFGIARSIYDEVDDEERLTLSHLLLGTPQYVAPEQIRDPKSAGPKADLYSLGLVLYAMLNGKPPFTGSTADVVDAHLHKTPAPLGGFGGLEEIVAALIAKEPNERPESARAVVAAIDRLPFAATNPEVTPILLPTPSQQSVQPPQIIVLPNRPAVPTPLIVVLGTLTLAVLGLAVKPLFDPPPPPVFDPAAEPAVPIVQPSPSARASKPDEPAVDEVDDDRTPPVEPAKKRSAHRERRAAKASSDPSARIHEVLRARGLSLADLESSDELHEALVRLKSSSPEEQAEREQAAVEIEAKLSRFAIDAPLLRKKILRVQKLLEAAAERLPADDYAALENRYLDVRAAIKPAVDPAAGEALAKKITELERDTGEALSKLNHP